MPDPPDLTGEILRVNRRGTLTREATIRAAHNPKSERLTIRPRALPPDYFVNLVFVALALAGLAQLILILALDLL